MKKTMQIVFICLTSVMVIFFTGCKWKESEKETSVSTSGITYSNLVDEESQDILRNALADAGVSQSSIDILLESVNQYNDAVGSMLPVQHGFAPFPDDYFVSDYDSDKLNRKWRKKYGNDDGRKNCRLTAFETMGSLVSYNEKAADVLEPLFIVELEDVSVFSSKEDMDKFSVLFSALESEEGLSVEMQSQRIIEYWKQAGIQFPYSDKICMISIFFNSPSFEDDDSYTLHCGHVCVMLHTEDNEVLLLEKLDYNFPYQLISFSSERSALDYVVTFHGGGLDASTAIMVNDKLLRKENGGFVY